MIPKVIKLIQEKEKVITSPDDTSKLKCICSSIPLSESTAYVVLTDGENEYICCDQCIGNNMYFKGKIIFKDTFSNYQKRIKTGWIKKLLKETKDAKDKKSS